MQAPVNLVCVSLRVIIILGSLLRNFWITVSLMVLAHPHSFLIRISLALWIYYSLLKNYWPNFTQLWYTG